MRHATQLLLTAALAAVLTPLWHAREAAAQVGGPTTFEAVAGPSSFALPVLIDSRAPSVEIISPADGSTLAGGVVTVTGVVGDTSFDSSPPSPVYGELLWVLHDDQLLPVANGTAPIVDGRFSIVDLTLIEGFQFLQVFAVDAAGHRSEDTLGVTYNPDAPPVALVSPIDGSAVLTSSVDVDLNFTDVTTLISVNGVPDGRELGPGLVADALTLPLEPGPNTFTLDFGSNTLSFTLFRVASIEPPRITSIGNGAFTNQPTLAVSGTVPLGTPYVEVNGIRAAIAGATFTATIPLREGTNPITAVAYPQASRTQIRVTLDSRPPGIQHLIPDDGTHTLDAEVLIGAVLDEAARVEVVGPAGSVSNRTRPETIGSFPASFVVHLAELDPLSLADGPNDLVLTATDAAGNQTVEYFVIEKTNAALVLASPADGSAIPALRVAPTVDVLANVTLDALYTGGLRIPGFEGATLTSGLVELPYIPLAPGPNQIRIVYHRDGGPQEVVSFAYQSTATDAMTVTGEVTDRATGAAVGGALVRVSVNGLTLIAVSSASGSYSVAVEAGTATVVAMAEGYSTESASASGAAGDTVVADVELDDTGIPSMANQLAILVPPDGTVTDFEQLTVVGTVHDPRSIVTVNGIAAEVVGHRFTARHVPLSMGANTLTVNASALGALPATMSVHVERAAEPVLAVKIFSPPAGATIPGSGLVVRGFVSAKNSRTLVSGGFAPLAEGVFELPDVFMPLGTTRIAMVSQTQDELQSAQASVPVTPLSDTPALVLSANPAIGVAPLEATLTLARSVPIPDIERIDFDTDGNAQLDVIGGPASIVMTIPTARPVVARGFVTTAGGVELSARVQLAAHLPSTTLTSFGNGNPVDLAPAPGGDFYVLDGQAATVSRYDLAGALVSRFGSPGVAEANLLSPQALAVDASGRIYVADTGNDRIQVFTSDGAHERSIGSRGSAVGQLTSPRGVAVTRDRIVVSDTGNNRVQIFSLTGMPIASATVGAPRGLADSESGVFLASPLRGTLALVDDALASRGPLDELPPGESPVAPVDVAVGDVIAIADSGGATVDVFASDGGLLRRVGPLSPPPVAVLSSARREMPTVLVADGTRVYEVSLPIPSPIEVLQSLKSRLGASDIDGALALVSPLRRDYFREMYTDVLEALPADAAAMQSFTVDFLREDRAIARIHTVEEIDGTPVPRSYPVHLRRAEDGTWQIYDY